MIFLYRDSKEIIDQHSSRILFLVLIATLFTILPLRSVWASDSEVSFSQDKAEIQHRFDQSFSELLKDGSIDAVYQQYLGTGYSKMMKPG